MATITPPTPATPPQDVQVVNPNLNQGRDIIVPEQHLPDGNSILTGKPRKTALDIFSGQQSEAAQPDFNWAVAEETLVAKVVVKPTLPPTNDPDAEINWNYNPQDDFVPSGKPATQAQIPTLPPESGTKMPFPDLQEGIDPDYNWNPQRPKVVGMTPINPPVKKPAKPPVDDVEANMANIWTPDPVYTTGKGTRP